MSDIDVDTSTEQLDPAVTDEAGATAVTGEAVEAPDAQAAGEGTGGDDAPGGDAPEGDTLGDDAAGDGVPATASDEASDEASDSLLVREGDIAADYLERLLDIADYDGDIDLDVENDRAVVAVVGSDLRSLVGAHGEILDALQELTRLAVAQQTGSRSRLMLDVSGHRQARREQLRTLAAQTAARVAESGEPVRLTPMNPFERKVVHDAIADIDGVLSESEGEEPNRRVVVLVAR